MVIEYNLIINLIIMVSIIAVLVAIALFIHDILKKEHELEDKEKKTLGNYHKIIKKAHSNAKSLMLETTVQAANILSGARHTNEKIEEDLDRVLQTVAQNDIHSLKSTTAQYEKEYQKLLEDIRHEMHETTQNVLKDTQTKYSEQVEKFTSELLKNGISTQAEVEKKKAELLSIAETEIEAYKNERIAKIDEEAKKLLEKVYKDVLRTSIPPSVHQELIIKSLEAAQKDGVFNL